MTLTLRIIREVDAFPASDIGLLRGAEKVLGTSMTPKVLALRAEAWRPWRAYAAQHLWAADGAASPKSTDAQIPTGSLNTSKGIHHELGL